MGPLLFLIYLSFCVLVAYAGKDTTLGFWGTLAMSIFLTPLVTAILLLLLRPKRKKSKDYD